MDKYNGMIVGIEEDGYERCRKLKDNQYYLDLDYTTKKVLLREGETLFKDINGNIYKYRCNIKNNKYNINCRCINDKTKSFKIRDGEFNLECIVKNLLGDSENKNGIKIIKYYVEI